MPQPLRRAFALSVGLMLPAALLGLRPPPAAASSQRVFVEGHGFDVRITLNDTELVLNGTGVRAVAWFKGYAAGLYLLQRASEASAVQAAPGPKRLRMVMLQEVPATEFSKAFVKGVSRNTEPDALERLRERMQQFVQWIDDGRQVRKGDIVDLDYTPAQGTQLVVNGRRQGGALPGDDFYAALLRAFVGQRPFDEKLKAGLLGRG